MVVRSIAYAILLVTLALLPISVLGASAVLLVVIFMVEILVLLNGQLQARSGDDPTSSKVRFRD